MIRIIISRSQFLLPMFFKSSLSVRKAALLILLLSLPAVNCLSNPAFAAETNHGAYAGARLGYSFNRYSCGETAIECDREDMGYGIFAGYDFNENFAYELNATRLGDSSAIYPAVALIGELSTIDLSVKYSRPLYENVQLFGKLGFTYWDGEVKGWGTNLSDSGERPAVGAGVEIPLSANVCARFEYQYFDELGNKWMGFTDAHFVSFALVWH